jgi:hypothetical protein
LFGNPRVVQRGPVPFGEAFNRCDFGVPDRRKWDDARANGRTIDMNGATPTNSDTTPELGSGETEVVSQNPEQRGVRIGLDFEYLPVHLDGRQFSILFAQSCGW